MNYVNTNRINDFIYMYNIQNTEDNFKKLEQIFYMVGNCRIVVEDSSGITVEIDLFEHRKLLEDLINKFFTKKLGNRNLKKRLVLVILLLMHS